MSSDACTADTLSPTSTDSTRRPPWLGLSILLLAGFVTIFDLFVVNVAIPSLQAELGASLSQIGFIVAGYELAFGVLLVTGARLGDLFGRRRLFILGMAAFTAASLLCGVAPTVEILIGARVLQGLIAIVAKLASVTCFVIVSALVKKLGDLPTGQVVFFRSAFAIPVILVWVWMTGRFPQGIKANNPLGHVWRGLVGTAAMALNFTALAYLPLPVATVFSYLGPFLVVLLAGVFLKEALGLPLLLAILLGLLGAGLTAWPQLEWDLSTSGLELFGIGAAMLAALLGASVQLVVRKMTATESVMAIAFWFSVTSMVVSGLTLPFAWVTPDVDSIILLVLAGFVGGLAQMLMTTAYWYSHASIVAPFDYWGIVLAIFVGVTYFGDSLEPLTLGGAALIVVAGLAIIWQKSSNGR